jgi:phosphotransferase system HPr-like phosphotransfer protein
MTSIKVSLNSIDKVKTFVNVINTFDGDFDLASDRYVIDAKSIMGIFSLDITNPLRLDIHNDSEVDAVKTALADYLVD